MQNATFVNSENPGDRTKIFRLRREAENASSNLFLSHGDFRGGYYLPDPLPPFPRKVQPSQEWLTRWDEGTWGFWATVKLITPMAFHVVRNRLTTRAWRRKSWAEFRHFLQSLGGLWIEVGLLLSRRPDLLGREANDEMSLLGPQYNVFPFEVTELLFLQQFGHGIEESFSEFRPNPVSVGVFSQTYRARLRERDTEVSVKVLRPDVAALLSRDLGILRNVFRICGATGIGRRLALPRLEWEIRQWLIQASDLRYQEANTRRLKKTLRSHKIYVPRTFGQTSSSYFLTKEYVDAPTLAELIALDRFDKAAALDWMDRNRIRPCKVGRKLFQSYLRQTFVDNLFQADLSPGNIVLLKNSRFALPNSGQVAVIDKQFAIYHAQMFRAISSSDYSKAVDYLFLTCDVLPRVGLHDLRLELIRLYRAFEMRSELRGVSFAERSFGALSDAISAVMFRRGVIRSWQGVNLDRGWTNIEQSLQFLNPDFSLREELKLYFQKADLLNSQLLGKEGLRIKIGRLIASLSEQTMFLSAQLRRRAQAFEGISKAAYVGVIFFKAVRRLLLIIVACLLIAHFGLHEHLGLMNLALYRRFAQWAERSSRIEIYTMAAVGLYGLYILGIVIRRLSQREAKER